MSTGRQPPMGTPALATHAGLTPQMSIVDANGRPTMFFFRWLLTIGGAALTSADNSILESFDPGADAALTESALADTLDAAQLAALTESAISDTLETAHIAAGFDDGNAARADSTARIDDLALLYALRSGGRGTGPRSDQRALEAFLMADAPQTPATPVTFLADTLANWTLANYNPANYANGQQFIVTTWQVTYAVEAGLWRYVAGVFVAPAASRPTTAFNGAALGAADAGLRFLASDTGVSQYWNGSAWVPIGGSATPSGPAGGDLGGTYPNPTVVKASGNFQVSANFTVSGQVVTPLTITGAYAAVPGVASLAIDYHAADPAARVMVPDGAGGWTGNLALQPYGGNIGIGTTTPAYKLQVAVDSAAKPATSTWTIASDARLKRNVQPLAGGLAKILALRPVEAQYNGEDGTPDGLRIASFIAQDVAPVLPHAVSSHDGTVADGDGKRTETKILDLNMHEILMHLVLAVQELAGMKPQGAGQ